MKKVLSLGLVLIMLFALSACNGNETQNKIAELEAKLQEQSRVLSDLVEDDNQLLDLISGLEEEKQQLLYQITVLEEALQRATENSAQTNEDFAYAIAALEEEINKLEQQSEQKQKTIDELISIMSEEKVEELLLGGCGEEATDPTHIPYQCGYKYLKILYNLDNVTFRFYCAHFDFHSTQRPKDYGSIVVDSGYVDENERIHSYDNEMEIDRIEDINAKANRTKTEDYASSVDDFNCYRDITIPQELFVDEKGFIRISLIRYLFISENEYQKSSSDRTSIFIYYKKVDSYIILSTERFS